MIGKGAILFLAGCLPFIGTAQKGKETVKDEAKWYEHISLQGYIQAQWSYTDHVDSVLLHSYSAGNFDRFVNNKFSVRRGRLQMAYQRDLVEASISFDVNETGFHAKDSWIRVTDKWLKAFHFTGGVFARPFGLEIELTSRNREALERSRVIQTLFPGIRDIGFGLKFRMPEDSPLHFLELDGAVFHGTSANLEVDSKKDIVGRLSVHNPFKSDLFNFNVGVSYYDGNVSHQYDIDGNLANYHFIWSFADTIGGDGYGWVPDVTFQELDSILNDTNNYIAPGTYQTSVKRTYLGFHGEVTLNLKAGGKQLGKTTLRGEYIFGQQPALVGSFGNPYTWNTYSPTGPFTGVTWPKYDSPQPYNPASVGPRNKPHDTFIRQFSGMYFYLTQQIGNTGLELVYRYDYYDPNTEISGEDIDGSLYDDQGNEIGLSFLTVADVAFTTHSLGLRYHFNERMNIYAQYDIVQNEITSIEPLSSTQINLGKYPHTGYEEEIKDNVFTLRFQYTF